VGLVMDGLVDERAGGLVEGAEQPSGLAFL
jgi:hypothetical protein